MFSVAKTKFAQLLFSLQGQLVLVMIVGIAIGDALPKNFVSFLYTVSLLLKEILELFVPFLVMSCIMYTITNLAGEALLFMSFLMITVLISNFVSTIMGYYCVKMLYSEDVSLDTAIVPGDNSISPLCDTNIQKILSNNMALILGISFGAVFVISKKPSS